jgi:hypothetical protein
MLIVPERLEPDCRQVSVNVPELLPLYWPDQVPVSEPPAPAVVVVIDDWELIELVVVTEAATDAWTRPVVDVVVAAFLLLPQARVITEAASTRPAIRRM